MNGRKPLHHGIFLLVGFLISVTSKIVSKTSPENNASMKLFFWIGIIFLVIGLIKLLIKKIPIWLSKETKLEDHLAGIDTINKEEQKLLKTTPSKNLEKQYIIQCPRCGTSNYNTSNYCHMCGMRLRK